MRSQALMAPWLVGAVIASTAAGAGPPRSALVAPDAKWVVHADVEAMVDSSCFRALLGADGPGLPVDDLLAQLKRETGLDPLRELRNATIYAPTYGADRTVSVLEIRSGKCEVIRHLRDQAGDEAAQAIQIDGLELHAITLHGRTRYLHVQRGPDAEAEPADRRHRGRGSVVVMGTNESDVLAAARRLREEVSESASATVPLPAALFENIPAGTLIHARAVDMKAMSRSSKTSDTVRQLAAAGLDAGETADGAFFLRLTLDGETTEEANGLVRSAERLRTWICAIASFEKRAPDDAGPAIPMDRAVQISREGPRVAVDIHLPLDEFRRFLAAIAQYHQNNVGADQSPL